MAFGPPWLLADTSLTRRGEGLKALAASGRASSIEYFLGMFPRTLRLFLSALSM